MTQFQGTPLLEIVDHMGQVEETLTGYLDDRLGDILEREEP